MEPSLLEEKVVELHIVKRVSDNTIGRTSKNSLKPQAPCHRLMEGPPSFILLA